MPHAIRKKRTCMFIHRINNFQIYFGDAGDGIYKHLHAVPTSGPLISKPPFTAIAQKLNLDQLVFLKQTHSDHGLLIDSSFPAFDHEGDYLLTQKPRVGIGVLTADCLPIVFLDIKNKAVAIAHAGWRGSVQGIAQKTVAHMQAAFGTQSSDLQIFFGPSANACCYQVSSDFKEGSYALLTRNGNTYLDMPYLNMVQLEQTGISQSACSKEFNHCTICDHRYFSYRRQAENAGRQMTIVSITA